MWLNFHKNFRITAVNLIDTLLFWTDDRNEPRKINIDVARANDAFYDGDDLAAVIKLHPLTAPEVTSTSVEDRVDPDNPGEFLPRSQFLERRLLRFAYRYKFRDGEFSPISPFTQTLFDPRMTNDADGFSFPSAIPSNSGEVLNFVNRLQTINLRIPVPTGYDITEVELIWKEQARPTIYIVDSQIANEGIDAEFSYTGQDPFRALPGSQLTRVSDAVPRTAKSQEVAGGRIVYGNFLQQFNLPRLSYEVNTTGEPDPMFPNHSVKSRRTYQIGVVLTDRFGRQTPVILSDDGTDTITVDAQVGNSDAAFQRLAITITDLAQLQADAPWATGYKVYVKQREQEYYNVFTTPSSSTAQHVRRGDTINKVPVDTTQATSGTNVASTAQLYPKVNSNGINRTESLRTIQGINTVEGEFTVAEEVADINSVVYETSPFESELDIYFETSTSGIIDFSEPQLNVPITFYNCYLVDNGAAHIEANRIRMGFNEPFFDVGVKASLVVEEYAEERRFNALIHSSGLFNSRTGINGLNQFNVDEGGLTIRLDPSDGSIQKLYAEDTQLIIWQEDKVSRLSLIHI